jgi:dTDP-glucose 4,6-dehydratase
LIITGAAGFVGTTLLLGEPMADDLVLVDPVKMDHVLLRSLGERVPRLEVRQSASLCADDPGDADMVLVLAGQTDVDRALADPAAAFTANPAIALDIGEWWRRHPTSRVVYLSTDEVLGVPGDGSLAEDAPLAPTQPYAASKAIAETTMRCYRDAYGMDLTILRACNLAGGRQRARKLIPTAVQEMTADRPVPVFGTGRQVREYLSVDDLCEAVRMAVAGALPPDTYHCSSAEAFTVLEVVDLIAKELGKPPRVAHVPDRLVQDRAYAMDPSRLQSFGWKPRVAPADAISRAAAELHVAALRGENLRVPPTV